MVRIPHVPSPELHLPSSGRRQRSGLRCTTRCRTSKVDGRHLVVLIAHIPAYRSAPRYEYRLTDAGDSSQVPWHLPQSFCMRLLRCSRAALPLRCPTRAMATRHIAAAIPVATRICACRNGPSALCPSGRGNWPASLCARPPKQLLEGCVPAKAAQCRVPSTGRFTSLNNRPRGPLAPNSLGGDHTLRGAIGGAMLDGPSLFATFIR